MCHSYCRVSFWFKSGYSFESTPDFGRSNNIVAATPNITTCEHTQLGCNLALCGQASHSCTMVVEKACCQLIRLGEVTL